MKIPLLFLAYAITSIAIVLSINFINPSALSEEEQDLFYKCENKTFIETVHCIEESIKPYYNYKIYSPDSDRTVEDIMENGGDCWDYANLYVKMIKNYGYDGRIELILAEDNQHGHTLALLYYKSEHNLNNYCVIDIDKVKYCWTSINAEETEYGKV